MNEVILVDKHDKQIGTMPKLAAHKQGALHRAFSIFLFAIEDHNMLLLQQRSPTKYHCGGLWTNSCCSHPKPGEALQQATIRRLQEELGLQTNLRKEGSFCYRAVLPNGLIEHEYDHVFSGYISINQVINYNEQEIAAVKWIDSQALAKDLVINKERYTPWLLSALTLILQK